MSLLDTPHAPWELLLARSIQMYMDQPEVKSSISPEHTADTPDRVVRAYKEYISGCFEDPREVLKTTFKDDNYNQMVHVSDISFVSMCAHHLVPIIGKVHFAYLPDAKVVGLSKVARLVKILAKRPQIQEKFSGDIVDTFMDVVAPKGCAVMVRAYHFCMIARGVQEPSALTSTTALRGCFQIPDIKEEFLSSIDRQAPVWP